jgi:hypothetical protein
MTVQGKEFATAQVDDICAANSYQKAREMAMTLKASSDRVSMVYFLASGIDIANDECIRGFEEVLGPDVTIFGATSSDNMKGVVSYQILHEKVCEHGAFAIGFYDETLKVDTCATHGFVAIGEPLIATKVEGNVIYELNGNPAWDEYTRRLGLESTAICGDTIPIGALAEKLSDDEAKEYGNEHILRVVTSKGEDGSIHYATTIKEGAELWLTKRDEDLIFTEMDRISSLLVEQTKGAEIVAVFHADCLARGRFLFGRVLKEELVENMQVPLSSQGVCPPWIGMYGFGEFARLGGRNEYHNYTTALYVLSRT